MARHGDTVSDREMRRLQAESFVRDAIGKSPAFKSEVNRVLKEFKRLDKTTQGRMGKPK